MFPIYLRSYIRNSGVDYFIILYEFNTKRNLIYTNLRSKLTKPITSVSNFEFLPSLPTPPNEAPDKRLDRDLGREAEQSLCWVEWVCRSGPQ